MGLDWARFARERLRIQQGLPGFQSSAFRSAGLSRAVLRLRLPLPLTLWGRFANCAAFAGRRCRCSRKKHDKN
jgi:hypothetical protein